jgi:hypothetical protein
MGKQVELLQGTLDMLILKAISLGPSMVTASCSGSSNSPVAAPRFSRDRSTPPCAASSAKD